MSESARVRDVLALDELRGALAEFGEQTMLALESVDAALRRTREWLEDQDDPANQHRHVSHLWAVYPGSEITPYGTPDLFRAARQSLIYRGDAATGWQGSKSTWLGQTDKQDNENHRINGR